MIRVTLWEPVALYTAFGRVRLMGLRYKVLRGKRVPIAKSWNLPKRLTREQILKTTGLTEVLE